MNAYDFSFAGTRLALLGSGALWWADRGLLCVSDLHLGKSERIARRGGSHLPPFDLHETLTRLEADMHRTGARTVICLGDSFDDLQAAENLGEPARAWLARLMAGRRWVWIEGNHDPGPVALGGSHMAAFHAPPLTFRHIARPEAKGEVSGHYHPKARLALGGKVVSRPAMLYDSTRIILPAYGTYTGGLRHDARALDRLMRDGAIAVLTGPTPTAIPMRRNTGGNANVPESPERN